MLNNVDKVLNEVSYKINSEEYQNTLDILDNILKKVPKNYRANLYKGQVSLSNKQFEDAIKHFEEAKKVDIKNFKAYNLLGISYHETKNYDKAIECFNETLKANPNSYNAYNLLGISYYKKQENKKAVFCWNKAIEINPKYDKAYNNLALFFYRKKNYKTAIEYFEKSKDLDNSTFKSYDTLGMCYYYIKNYNKAIEYLKLFVDNSSNAFKVSNTIGVIYSILKEYDKAIEYFNKAIEFNPKYFDAYNNIASLYYNSGKFDKAAFYFDKAKKFDTQEKFRDYYKLGISNLNKKHYYDAIEAFENVITKNEKSYKAYNLIGVCYLSLEEYEKSIPYFKKSLDINNKYHKAYKNLGNAYFQLKDYKNALENFNFAINISDENDLYNKVGICYYHIGDNDKSIEYLNMATKNNDMDLDTYKIVFELYMSNDDYDNALYFAKKLYDIEPDFYYDKIYSVLKIYFEKENYNKIIDQFDNINIFNSLEYYNILAISAYKIKEYDISIKYYELMIVNYKNELHFDVYNNLAILYYFKKDFNKMLETYNLYLENFNDTSTLASYNIFLLLETLFKHNTISYKDFLILVENALIKSIKYNDNKKIDSVYKYLNCNIDTLKLILENKVNYVDNSILNDAFDNNRIKILEPIFNNINIFSFTSSNNSNNYWKDHNICIEYEIINEDNNSTLIKNKINSSNNIYGKKAKFINKNEELHSFLDILSYYTKEDEYKILIYKNSNIELKIKAIYLSNRLDDNEINLIQNLLKNKNINLYKINNSY